MAGFWFQQALLPGGWADGVRVEVTDGVIHAVTPDCAADPTDERHAIALPGMPNLHSHAFQRGMAGLAEVRGPGDDSFWTWREVMYRFAHRIGPDEMQAIASMAFVEMLEGGFTRVGEFHYIHHDLDGHSYDNPAEMGVRLAASAAETGIGLTLLPVLYQYGGFGAQAPSEGQKRFINGLDAYARLLERSRAAVAGLPDGLVGVAPHSLRAVNPASLAQAALLAEGGPIHIHIAEQIKEVADCHAWSGQRPVSWLFDHAPVNAQWCLVHATHMDAAETARLAASGAVAGLCPITEANLGDGIFNARDFQAAGGLFGIGSDSNVLIDAAEELRSMEYAQRLAHRARNVLGRRDTPSTGRVLFEGALAGGARALGRAAGLMVGASADFVTLEATQPSLAARRGDGLLDGYIFAGQRMVDGVWRRGRRVVSGGRHVVRDAVAARYRLALGTILS
ncbi:formimidoylglutamate deiminase [Niveispirillum sp. KHB5.9]|uniref:formimidoylglutamate deiminase n=1 Tax=Niveispirillum sp. KHB5.9 TaxID=3400269 RepID=UPI003A8BD271